MAWSQSNICTNSKDPDQIPQNMASNLGLHFLPHNKQCLDTPRHIKIYGVVRISFQY